MKIIFVAREILNQMNTKVTITFLRAWISCSLSGLIVFDLTLRVDFRTGPEWEDLLCFDPFIKILVSFRKQI